MKYALIVANTEYSDPLLARLSAPGKDAEDFARVLRDKEIGEFDDVKVLLNEPEPVAREAIDEFFDQKKPDDLLILYFSGHGIRDEVGSLYLALKNTTRARLRATAIKSDFIRDAMNQSRSRRQVIILDCCNSGAFAQGSKAIVGASIGTATAFQGAGSGHIVLTASDSTQFAWEGDQIIGNETENSLFTHFLIEGLKGEADQNNDGVITVDDLFDYAYEQIVMRTPKQTPGKWAYKQQGDIVLRKITRIENIKPASLSNELLEAIGDSRTFVREGAVGQLAKIIKDKNLGLARAAREVLKKIAAEDDSKKVSRLASQALESIRQEEAEQIAIQKAEEESQRLAAQKAEEERLAREQKAKEEAERLAGQRAEVERFMREKAKSEKEEYERLANQKAEQERLARQRAEEQQKNQIKVWILFSGIGVIIAIVALGLYYLFQRPSDNSKAPVTEQSSATQTEITSNSEVGLLADVLQRGYLLVSTDPNYEPQSFLNTSGERPSNTVCPSDALTTSEIQGFDVDVAKAIGEALGVETCFATPSWDAITAGNWADKWDINVGSMAITVDRQKILDFSIPYYYMPAVVSVADNSGITSLDGLSGQAVCAGSATAYEAWLNGDMATLGLPESSIYERVPDNVTVILMEVDQECAQSIAAGRKDFIGYITSEVVADANLAAGIPVVKLERVVFSEDFGIAFDKSSSFDTSELRAEIDKIISAMRSDGTLSQFSLEWFGVDLTKTPNQ